jgi:hypothetical protein
MPRIISNQKFFSFATFFVCLLFFNSTSFAEEVAKNNVSYVLSCKGIAEVSQERLDRIDSELETYEKGSNDKIAGIYFKMSPMMKKVLAFQIKQSEDLSSNKERKAYLKEIKGILKLCDKISDMNEEIEKSNQ